MKVEVLRAFLGSKTINFTEGMENQHSQKCQILQNSRLAVSLHLCGNQQMGGKKERGEAYCILCRFSRGDFILNIVFSVIF